MLFSFDAIESLPLFSKLPLNSKEKRILGIWILLTSGITLFVTVFIILFSMSKAKEKTLLETKEEIDVITYNYDSLEVDAMLTKVEQLINADSFFIAGEYLQRLKGYEYQLARKERLTAKLLLNQERHNEARKLLEEQYRAEPKNVPLAIDYIKTFSVNELLELGWESLVPELIESPRIMTTVATIILDAEPLEAYAILRESYKRNPHNPQTSAQLGHFFTKTTTMKDYGKSKKFLGDAITLGDNSVTTMSQYALTVHKLWDMNNSQLSLFKKAEFLYKQALEKQPSNEIILYNLGELYSSLDEYAIQAEESYLKAIELNHRFWQPSFKLGLLYLKNRKYTGALERFESALNNSPQNIRILHQIAITHEESGDPTKALEIYKAIASIAPTDPIALYKVQFLKNE